jgi:hypothetical protein
MEPDLDQAVTKVAAAVVANGGESKFEAYVAENWPRLSGAGVADVLEMCASYDMFAEITEPFFVLHDGELSPVPARTVALQALIILGGELTCARLMRLLNKAGYGPRVCGYSDAMADRPTAELDWPEGLRERYRAGYADGRSQPRRVPMDWQESGQPGVRTAQGEFAVYMVARSYGEVAGRGWLLTRWTRGDEPGELGAMTVAIANMIRVASEDQGREFAESYEGGLSIPFHGQTWSYTDVGGLAVTVSRTGTESLAARQAAERADLEARHRAQLEEFERDEQMRAAFPGPDPLS